MSYKAKQSKADYQRDYMRRKRGSNKTGERSNKIAPGSNINPALVMRLNDERSIAKLRTICMILNRSIASVNKERVNMLDMVLFGIGKCPVTLRKVAEILKVTPD